MTARERVAGNVANYVDERTGAAAWMKKNLNKVFPDHWSFMLGEIALYSFTPRPCISPLMFAVAY